MRDPKRLRTVAGWILLMLLAGASLPGSLAGTEPAGLVASPTGARTYRAYPDTYPLRPELASPYTDSAGRELITALTWDNRYAVVPVTVGREDGLMTRGPRDVKASQQIVDGRDFPTLAMTGLHSERELTETLSITGKPVDQITRDGQPGALSGAGFLAEDEEILAVLRGDNTIVRKLGLTHPDLARPLFHVYNLILAGREKSRSGRGWERFTSIYYNGQRVHLDARGTKGWQESIFQDEIGGHHDFYLQRDFTDAELKRIRKMYAQLDEEELDELLLALSRVHVGEIHPYYITRYGFYEGHTDYRADPLAIAFIFGLRSLEEIEAAFPGRLHEVLTEHHR
jgi:hypothetical protein